jgi:hypothetical protein
VGVQEVRWDKGDTIIAGDYNIFYGKRNQNHQLETGFFVHHKIVSAIKIREFFSDRMYIVLRGCWCNFVVWNVHAPSEEKTDDSEDRCYEELKQVFKHFLSTILLGDSNAKVEER